MTRPDRKSLTLFGLILFQAFCLAFFLFDVIEDFAGLYDASVPYGHFLPEAGATLGMAIGLVFETRYLIRLLRRQAHMERGLGVAAGELAALMEDYFRRWGLTAAEADVAAFTIKGYSIAEIAGLRGSAEATVKTHLNAIYRKSGAQGRGQLVSVLIEDLMRAPLVSGEKPMGAGALAEGAGAKG
jgi:DNA-binding CsgD family transcriptional regulator